MSTDGHRWDALFLKTADVFDFICAHLCSSVEAFVFEFLFLLARIYGEIVRME